MGKKHVAHSICLTCWDDKNPGRGPVTDGDQPVVEETCCFCGAKTFDGLHTNDAPPTTERCK